MNLDPYFWNLQGYSDGMNGSGYNPPSGTNPHCIVEYNKGFADGVEDEWINTPDDADDWEEWGDDDDYDDTESDYDYAHDDGHYDDDPSPYAGT